MELQRKRLLLANRIAPYNLACLSVGPSVEKNLSRFRTAADPGSVCDKICECARARQQHAILAFVQHLGQFKGEDAGHLNMRVNAAQACLLCSKERADAALKVQSSQVPRSSDAPSKDVKVVGCMKRTPTKSIRKNRFSSLASSPRGAASPLAPAAPFTATKSPARTVEADMTVPFKRRLDFGDA